MIKLIELKEYIKSYNRSYYPFHFTHSKYCLIKLSRQYNEIFLFYIFKSIKQLNRKYLFQFCLFNKSLIILLSYFYMFQRFVRCFSTGKKTCLYDTLVDSKGKMVEFAGNIFIKSRILLTCTIPKRYYQITSSMQTKCSNI